MDVGMFLLRVMGQQQAAAAPTGIVSLDTIFWASVLAIFLITIISAFVRRLTKDKAFKLFNEYHVTFFSERRPGVGGALLWFSRGVELLFDKQYTTRRGVVKSSALLFDDEFTPFCGLTRSVHGLTRQEA